MVNGEGEWKQKISKLQWHKGLKDSVAVRRMKENELQIRIDGGEGSYDRRLKTVGRMIRCSHRLKVVAAGDDSAVRTMPTPVQR